LITVEEGKRKAKEAVHKGSLRKNTAEFLHRKRLLGGGKEKKSANCLKGDRRQHICWCRQTGGRGACKKIRGIGREAVKGSGPREEKGREKED